MAPRRPHKPAPPAPKKETARPKPPTILTDIAEEIGTLMDTGNTPALNAHLHAAREQLLAAHRELSTKSKKQ